MSRSSLGIILAFAAASCGTQHKTSEATDAGDGAKASAAIAPDDPKRGVAYHFCGWPFCRGEGDLAGMTPGLSWYYNWSSKPMDCADGTGVGTSKLITEGAVEFVPMAWGLVDDGRACESGGACFRVDERAGGTACQAPCEASGWSFRPDSPCYLCLHEGISRDAFVRDIPKTSRYLLGFNEPNFQEQANLTPRAAAVGWRHVEWVADKRGLKLVGPATNFCDPTPGAEHAGACIGPVDGHAMLGLAWLERFYDECSKDGAAKRDCRIDHQAVHAYSCRGVSWVIELMRGKAGLTSPTEVRCANGVQDGDEFGVDCGGNTCTACSARARAMFAKSVWLTEFSTPRDDCGVTDPADLERLTQRFIATDLPKLSADPYVFRYAWFMPKVGQPNLEHNDLLIKDEAGRLTPLGRAYFGLSAR